MIRDGAPSSGVPEPRSYLDLTEEAADDLLTRLEEQVPVLPVLDEIAVDAGTEAVVFGDTHGDWRSTQAIAGRFLHDPQHRLLVGLGDYVDRAPEDCGEGSVANALFLLELASRFPGRVVLIRGNHESDRQVAVLPHDLPEEVDQLWGPDVERYARLSGLLERGPLAATTPSGVYLAHGGFPRSATAENWRTSFEPVTEGVILDVTWGECAAARSHRGMPTVFTERDLDRFLGIAGLHVFLRGHDPDLSGRSVFHDRCLTLHSSRRYERFGGVLCAIVPIGRPVRSTHDVVIEHVETEGREFPDPH